MAQQNFVSILNFLTWIVILDQLIARTFQFHLVLQFFKMLFFLGYFSIYFRHFFKVIGLQYVFSLYFQSIKLGILRTMLHMIRTVIEDFNPEETLSKLALRIDGIVFRIFGYNMQRLV